MTLIPRYYGTKTTLIWHYDHSNMVFPSL